MATRIPIHTESGSFEDRQKNIWQDMERDMERRRREWEDEINNMRTDFFHPPDNAPFAGHGTATAVPRLPGGFPAATAVPRLPGGFPAATPAAEDGTPTIVKGDSGQPVFQVRFNMQEYKPDEVNVTMDATKVMVSAKHEEKDGGSTVSREYRREVNIPRDVNPLTMQCSLNPDGYLFVHAPLPVPSYSSITDSTAAAHAPPEVLKSATSHETSSTVSSHPSARQVSGPTPGVSQHPAAGGKPPATFTQPLFNHEEIVGHPDHVVQSYKPPPDLSKLDPDSGPGRGQFPDSGPGRGQFLDSGHSQTSAFSEAPAFSTFPASALLIETSSPAQLSAPTVSSHDGKFQLTMPILDYQPEELTVRTQNGKVIICAKRQVASGNTAQTTEMNREHSLPGNVDPLTVKAYFTDTNNLIVEAPFISS